MSSSRYWNLREEASTLKECGVSDFESLVDVEKLQKKVNLYIDESFMLQQIDHQPEGLKDYVRDIILHTALLEANQGNPQSITRSYVYGAVSTLTMLFSGAELMKSSA